MNRTLVKHAALGIACGIAVLGCSSNDATDDHVAIEAKEPVVTSPAPRAALPLQSTRKARAPGPGQPSADGLPHGVHRDRDGRYTRDVCDHNQDVFCFSEILLPRDWKPGDPPFPTGGLHPDTAGSPIGMAPADVVTAYNLASTQQANGAIVAIVDLADTNAASDLAAYRSNYGLPALPTCTSGHGGVGATPCFSKVNETGGTSSGDDGGSWDAETSLDMDMVSAACPDCSILLVELTSSSDVETGVATALSLGAVATSLSLGTPEADGYPTAFTTAGHLVLASSGDYGYDDVDDGATVPSWPASVPSVLSVGGTNLFLNSGNQGSGSYSEAVWSDGTFADSSAGKDVTTSGCSVVYPMPSWQIGPVNGACGTGASAYKATADLSAAATYTTKVLVDGGGNEYEGKLGISIYCSGAYYADRGYPDWFQAEGTSASSPLMAGLLARIGLAAPIADSMSGLSGISVYASTSMAAFNDLGSSSYPVNDAGSSTNAEAGCSPSVLCTVGTGWDGPSGVGTPNAATLAALRGSSTGPRGGHGRPL